MIGNATVTRVRQTPGGTDADGDPIEGTETRSTIEGCAVAPRSTADITDRGRQGVLVGLTLYLPFGTDVDHRDRFEVDGSLFDVDGIGGSWSSPFSGWQAGVEVALKRASG